MSHVVSRTLQYSLYLTKQGISDFGQDPRHRPKLDIQRLVELFTCWADLSYDVSKSTTEK